ncbi:MAG: YccF domain-containing protein [Oscillospiraceae bacterium]|jgi:uncharacterized membrane protein YccF (DUF307 family)|nr:YccF domain-containing protein [Oscillospiraceae bacterium]
MKLLGNILWVIFGGLILSATWFICGLALCITVVGIPIGIQCFKFANLTLWPFGKKIIHTGNVGGFLLNLLWVLVFGWELCLIAIVVGVLWSLTVVGIPFAIQSFKFAELALMPFGTKVLKSSSEDFSQ